VRHSAVRSPRGPVVTCKSLWEARGPPCHEGPGGKRQAASTAASDLASALAVVSVQGKAEADGKGKSKSGGLRADVSHGGAVGAGGAQGALPGGPTEPPQGQLLALTACHLALQPRTSPYRLSLSLTGWHSP